MFFNIEDLSKEDSRWAGFCPAGQARSSIIGAQRTAPLSLKAGLPPLDLEGGPAGAEGDPRLHFDVGEDAGDGAAGELFAERRLDLLDHHLVDPGGDRRDDPGGVAAGGAAGAV